MAPMMLTGHRSSGLLLHPTSLPGPHGSGDLGPAARAFADFLAAAGQRWWQMLPVAPPGAAPGYSPYSSYSAFAGSPWLINLETLAADGLLTPRDLRAPADVRRGDPGAVQQFREQRLRAAYAAFPSGGRWRDQFDAFRHAHRDWLDDFSLFSALKAAHGTREWPRWPAPIRLRRPAALKAAMRDQRDEVAYHQFVQFLFDRQWSVLRRDCHDRGVGLIGDIPIFVALDSADVWAHPRLFLLERTGRPKVVSGCPPDVFSCSGQLWGHPHYNWPAHARSHFAWWVRRFETLLHRFDAVRVDHFLGFNRAWAIPARAKTARRGAWLPGPGDEIFRAVRAALGDIPIIAEDLGAVVPEAEQLRDRWHFPGMRVLQFGFGPGGQYHLPHNYPRRCVAYTGTHDNQTIVGWFRDLARRNGHAAGERDKAIRYVHSCDPRQIHWDMIRAAMLSPADTVIVPVQDILGLGNDARMNTPGLPEDQWRWRLSPNQLTPALARQLKELTELSDREGR